MHRVGFRNAAFIVFAACDSVLYLVGHGILLVELKFSNFSLEGGFLGEGGIELLPYQVKSLGKKKR